MEESSDDHYNKKDKDDNDFDLDGNAVVRRYKASGAHGPPTEEVLSLHHASSTL